MKAEDHISDFIPAEVCYDPFQLKTLADARYIVQHEIDLYEEGEDGHLGLRVINKCRKALRNIDKEEGKL